MSSQKHRRRRSTATVAALATASILGACGDERATEEKDRATVPPTGTVNVRLTYTKILPANVTVEKPGEFEFKVRNTGRKVHALRIDGPPPIIMVETEDLRRGKSDTIRADLSRPGKYAWYCPYHRGEGMRGTITVPKP